MSSVVLGANSTLLIGSNVTVAEEGASAALSMIANTGSGALSTTQTGVNLTANLWGLGNIFLATGTKVSGSITSAGLLTEQSGVTVGGSISEKQSLSSATTAINVVFPSSSTDVTLQPGQTSSIAPGAFAGVTVNSRATLTLSSGTYYMDSLDVEPQGVVSLSGPGPFVLNVRSAFNAKGQIVLPVTASAPPTLLVVYAGTSDVFLQAEFDGTLIAPNANVTLAAIGTGVYHGAFFGKSLTLQAGVNILHRGTSAGTVTPIAECIVTQASGNYLAVFGYTSSASLGNITVPLGANNSFEPALATQPQPTSFSPGRQTAQFAVPFNGKALVWNLDGNSTTASILLPQCTPACVQQLTNPSLPPIHSVLPTPAAPLSIDESIVQRDSFRWDDALPVPETFPDGTARMYYGLVYMNSQASLETMDALRINYDNVPLFDPEMQSYQQQGLTTLSYPFDGQGQFAFAMVPGATYNALISAALDPTQPVEIFQALQLRAIPATDSGLAVPVSCGLQPIAQCVAVGSNGSLRAVFSYSNPAGGAVTVPVGPDNALTGAPTGTLPPEAFATGQHTAVFAVPFATGATVNWLLSGKTVSINSKSTVCSASIVSQIGVDHFNPFPPPATPTCRSATPGEALYPNSALPPAARVNTCASLSYQYAGTIGFQWRGVESDSDDVSGLAADADLALQDSVAATSAATSTTNAAQALQINPPNGNGIVARQKLFGKLFHKIVSKVASVGKSAVDGVRRGLTSVVGVFTGSTDVTITASALNTDSYLNPGGPATPMVQAWGAAFGQPISLQGIQARASKSLFLSVGDLGSNNSASVKVLNNLGAHICFTARNGAAKIVDWTTLPVTICPGDSSAQIGGSPPTTRTVKVQDSRMNAMAQMTDGHLYMSKVAGFNVNQLEALIGTVPNLLGALNGDRAFTPCWSFSWANDVATFMTALGAVAADHANDWSINKIEIGAKYVAKGVNDELARINPTLATLATAATQLAGTAQASLANAAVSAANTAATQIQAAETQAALWAQDANDLVGAAGTAARLTSAGNARANTAMNGVQTTLSQVSTRVPVVNTAVQAASTAATNASTAIAALASALDPTSALGSSIATVKATSSQVASSFINFNTIMTQAVGDTERVSVDTLGAVVGSFIGNSPVGQIFEAFATADLLLTAHKDDHCLSDRGIATHEYGHFTLCNLLDSVNAAQFAVAYDEAAASGFITGQASSATGSVMNESFADLISSQVVGGTNYGKPSTGNPLASSNMIYCRAQTSPTPPVCIDDNVASIYPNPNVQAFNDEVLRATSLYTDAFDGNPFPPDVDSPTNGAEWSASGSGMVLAPFPGPASKDDVVGLAGAAFHSWIAHALDRGTLLREDSVFGGLSDAMIDQSVGWCARCQLFKLHTTDASGSPICPTAWVGPQPVLPGTSTLLACIAADGTCPAGTTANPSTQVCEPPCPPDMYFDAFKLTCLPNQIIR
jgi:hypothetical protein